MFHCYYGEKKQNNHGDPCANTTVTANGVNITGHEDVTTGKGSVTITDVSLTSEELEAAVLNKRYEPVTWKSTDIVNNTGTYSHRGWWEITKAVTQIPGRPNHS